MRAPRNSSGITESWVQYVLNHYENSKNSETIVEVKTFSFSSATKPGESFNAELVKMDVSVLLSGGGRPPDQEKEYNLIVKFLSIDPFSREMIRKFKYHIKEYQMYSEVIPALNNFQASKTDNSYPIIIPEFIYGKCTDKEYVLVIQNMKVNGFETNPKENGLNLEQTKMTLEHIARLHGISYAFNLKYDFLEKYPLFEFSPDISTFLKPVVYVSVDNTINFLEKQENCKEIATKLKTGRSKLPEKFEALWDNLANHKMMCLAHGDFWNSNLLFRNDPVQVDGVNELIDLCLIDWQISQWNNPIMDLHYLIYTSTTTSLRSRHLEDLLHHYHTILSKVTVDLGAPIPDWSYEQFKAEFDRLALVGLLMGICLTQGTLSKEGEKIGVGQDDECNCCGLSCVVRMFKKASAKVIVPMALHPKCNCILKLSIKKLLKPFERELLLGENKVMNSRLLDLVEEAYQKGILDSLNS